MQKAMHAMNIGDNHSLNPEEHRLVLSCFYVLTSSAGMDGMRVSGPSYRECVPKR